MNKNRFVAYLAEERPFSEYSLEAVLSRQRETIDSIDLKQHDRKYHGGSFNPITMQCQMRRALENGDLADVLKAEDDEARERIRFVRHHPEDCTDDDFVDYYGKPNEVGQKRLPKVIRKLFKPADEDGGGTLIGMIDGLPVYPHTEMDHEMVRSKNAYYMMRYDKETFKDKFRLLRHLKGVLAKSTIVKTGTGEHKSKHHALWQKAKGFACAPFEYRGKPWYFVFTRTADDRLLLYDYVQKEL